MPGCQWGQSYAPGGLPTVGPYLLAGGSVALSGTGTPPAAALKGGDIVVLTTKSTLTASSVPVVRMLLAADKTADFKESAVICGILGIIAYDVAGNGSGQATGAPSPGTAVATGADLTPNFASIAQGDPIDTNTNRQWLRIILANETNIFRIASATAVTPALIGTQFGVTLSTTAGVTTYTANNTSITSGNVAIFGCVGVDSTDPLYGSVGGHIFVKVLPAYCQINTQTNYSTQ